MFRSLFRFLILALSFLVPMSAFAREKVELTSDNTVVLRGEVNGQAIANVMQQIMSSPREDLYLFVNSPGGSIVDGLRLVTLLQNTTKKVTCVTNMAASMAFIIMQACPKRLVMDDAILMQHVATYGVEGQAPNNHSMVKFIERMIKKMDEMQAKRLGLSYKEFKAKTRNDWWLFGDDSVKAAAADDVATVTCSKDLVKKTTSETKTVFIFSFNVLWSNCPIIESPLRIEAPKGRLQASPQPEKKQDDEVNKNETEYAEELQQLIKDLDWRGKLLQRFHGDPVKMPNVVE